MESICQDCNNKMVVTIEHEGLMGTVRYYICDTVFKLRMFYGNSFKIERDGDKIVPLVSYCDKHDNGD